jgi:hypothetical protein
MVIILTTLISGTELISRWVHVTCYLLIGAVLLVMSDSDESIREGFGPRNVGRAIATERDAIVLVGGDLKTGLRRQEQAKVALAYKLDSIG